MDTKLTLKLDQEIIEKAKHYASEKKISLSRIVENYLNSLTSDKENNDIQISPFVKSLSSGIEIPADYDYKKEIDNNFNRRLDTNAIISSILIFRYGLETSGEKNWTNIYDTRNSKAAHPEKGIVTIQELIILINFIIFLLESENLNNKNYNFSLIKPNERIERLR